MKFFGGDPFLSEDAGTYGDRSGAIPEISLRVCGCDSAARQEFDLGERALDLLKIIGSETSGREDLDHRCPRLPRFINILRDQRARENRDLVLSAVADHGRDDDGADDKSCAGMKCALEILQGQDSSRSDHELLAVLLDRLLNESGGAFGVHRDLNSLEAASGDRLKQRR